MVSRSLKNYSRRPGAAPCDATRVTMQSAARSPKSSPRTPTAPSAASLPAPSRGPCDQPCDQPGRAQHSHLRGHGAQPQGPRSANPRFPGLTPQSVHSLVPLPRTRFDTFLLIMQVSTHSASEITKSLSFIICVQWHVSLQFSQGRFYKTFFGDGLA